MKNIEDRLASEHERIENLSVASTNLLMDIDETTPVSNKT